MPPPIPHRFRLEVRLGRDGDVEEWLGVDTSLDRPVLVRILGPDSDQARRRTFLEAVRAAAGVAHPHLAAVFNAGQLPDGAYSISEWCGGMTLADRLAAGETLDPIEFLPNAAGLSSALAALHAEGVVHGAIDPGAVYYSVAHPAKLGRFGRSRSSHTVTDDVRALARTLEEAVTGVPPGSAPPSEIVDGLSPSIDDILRRAQAGGMTAAGLAEELAAVPTPPSPQPEPPTRRLLGIAALLVLAAVGLVALGRLFLVPPGTPVVPTAVTTAPSPTVSQPVTGVPSTPSPLALRPRTLDPFGDGAEHDSELANLTDGDPSTSWSTETYLDPLPLLKQGVGLAFEIEKTPHRFEAFGMTPRVEYVFAWTPDQPDNPTGWETVATGRLVGDALSVQLPRREGGVWILWFQDLPGSADTGYRAQVAEVRFRG